jgi:UDP-3-O-[3-hydroxymyristoyl] N-acetylglucosamine deacetylase
MAAFYITGIDNIVVEINNSEIPIMDGSSRDFIDLIKKAGIEQQYTERKFLKIVKKIELKEKNKKISIEPNKKSLEVDFQLGYENEVIGDQKNSINFENQDLEDVYSSRTFCLYEDIEKIKKYGLAKGGSLDNAIVVKDDTVMNDGGLRNDKEFVNHKILDLVGDFLLSGYRIIGRVSCVQGGHQLSNIFLKEILKDSSNFKVVRDNSLNVIEKNFKTQVNKLVVNA